MTNFSGITSCKRKIQLEVLRLETLKSLKGKGSRKKHKSQHSNVEMIDE